MKIMSVSASSCSSLTLLWRDSRSDRSRPDILCSSATLPTSLQEVSFKYGPIHSLELDEKQLGRGKRARYYVMKKRFPKSSCTFAISEDQELPNELEHDVLEQDNNLSADDVSISDPSFVYEGSGGRPGLLSFYGYHRSKKDDVLVPITDKNQHTLLWFVAPAVLVASFIFPSLYLRQILSTIFEDSLLTG
ncbi:hypothetical protein LIER_32642 [Lithospermum erythrorhizon]|uniref:Uncharacterized protein n=1 Tax=Lithospermum erythrorhizon TaxID=34254 RepID=A0AAV3RWN2_LITER